MILMGLLKDLGKMFIGHTVKKVTENMLTKTENVFESDNNKKNKVINFNKILNNEIQKDKDSLILKKKKLVSKLNRLKIEILKKDIPKDLKIKILVDLNSIIKLLNNPKIFLDSNSVQKIKNLLTDLKLLIVEASDKEKIKAKILSKFHLNKDKSENKTSNFNKINNFANHAVKEPNNIKINKKESIEDIKQEIDSLINKAANSDNKIQNSKKIISTKVSNHKGVKNFQSNEKQHLKNIKQEIDSLINKVSNSENNIQNSKNITSAKISKITIKEALNLKKDYEKQIKVSKLSKNIQKDVKSIFIRENKIEDENKILNEHIKKIAFLKNIIKNNKNEINKIFEISKNFEHKHELNKNFNNHELNISDNQQINLKNFTINHKFEIINNHQIDFPQNDQINIQKNIITQIKQNLNNLNIKNEVIIKLHPPKLGKIHLKLVMVNHELTAKITTENHMVKDAILNNFHSLNETLKDKGINLSNFQVNVQGEFDDNRDSKQQKFAKAKKTINFNNLFDEDDEYFEVWDLISEIENNLNLKV